HLGRTRGREIDRFTTQLRNRLVTLVADVAPRPLEQILLLGPRFLEHVSTRLLRDLSGLGDESLRLITCVVDLRLVLRKQLRGLLAVALGAFDCILERFFARFNGAENGRERPLLQNEEK